MSAEFVAYLLLVASSKASAADTTLITRLIAIILMSCLEMSSQNSLLCLISSLFALSLEPQVALVRLVDYGQCWSHEVCNTSYMNPRIANADVSMLGDGVS
jgi:hypothetical protein